MRVIHLPALIGKTDPGIGKPYRAHGALFAIHAAGLITDEKLHELLDFRLLEGARNVVSNPTPPIGGVFF